MTTSEATTRDPITRFGLIRHAVTAWNLEKRIQGQRDIPLAPEGAAAAGRWATRLTPSDWDRIMTSDLDRAVSTAREMNRALRLPMIEDRRLREQDWGDWVGMTMAGIHRRYPDALRRHDTDPWGFSPPGGESALMVWHRAIDALVGAAGRWPAERILVITHQGVIRSLVYRILLNGDDPAPVERVKPRHLHLLSCRGGRLAVETVNATGLDHTPMDRGA